MVESDIDKMIAISDIYKQVLRNLEEISRRRHRRSGKAGMTGLRWPSPGGESLSLHTDDFVAVDGIDKVIDIFEKIEDESWMGWLL